MDDYYNLRPENTYSHIAVSLIEYELIHKLRRESKALNDGKTSIIDQIEAKYKIRLNLFNEFENTCYVYYSKHLELTEKQIKALENNKQKSFVRTRPSEDIDIDFQSAFGY